jgi:hypothetical protein
LSKSSKLSVFFGGFAVGEEEAKLVDKRRKTAAFQLAEARRSKLQGEEMHSIEFTLRRVELEALRLHLLPRLILLIWL